MASQVEEKAAKRSIAVVCVHVFGIQFLLKSLQETANVLEMTAQRHLTSNKLRLEFSKAKLLVDLLPDFHKN